MPSSRRPASRALSTRGRCVPRARRRDEVGRVLRDRAVLALAGEQRAQRRELARGGARRGAQLRASAGRCSGARPSARRRRARARCSAPSARTGARRRGRRGACARRCRAGSGPHRVASAPAPRRRRAAPAARLVAVEIAIASRNSPSAVLRLPAAIGHARVACTGHRLHYRVRGQIDGDERPRTQTAHAGGSPAGVLDTSARAPYGPRGRSPWLDVDWRTHQRWVTVAGQPLNTIELGRRASRARARRSCSCTACRAAG